MSNTHEIILNLDQQPFVSFDLAAKMRDLLMLESANNYQVELFDKTNDEAGFVVIRTKKEAVTHDVMYYQEPSATPTSRHQPKPQETNSLSFKRKVYHPALRTYVLTIPWMLVGLPLVLFPVDCWLLLLSLFGMSGLPAGINGGLVLTVTKMIGTVWLLWPLSKVFIHYYGTALIIDRRGLTFQQGILTKNVTNVRFAEIRTIGLRQGILDRLLNIGILEFASSGTDDVDIRFINMVNPAYVKAEIETLIEQFR